MARYFKARLLVCALIILTLLTGLVLSSSYTKAGDDKGPGDTVSCTLAYTEGTSRSVSMTNGSYLTDIGNSTMQTICDDASGYAIYTVGYSNNEFGNNNMIATINGVLNPTYNIASSNASSGNTSAWAMKANAITGLYAPTIDNEFGEYRAIPEEYTRLAYLTDTTDDTTGSSINLTYAIYVSSTQPAGTYVGKVKYTLVHPHDETPCVEGKICYHKNANNVVGSMGRQNATGATAMLMASNFSHEGYGFAGWNTEEDGTGTSYGPNETITLPSDMSEGLNLYAMWVKSAGNLQDWDGCYTMNIGDVTALTDERDNDTYAIAKLADGKCWMIENLRLDNSAELTIANTNNPLNDGTTVTLKHNYDDTITYNTLSPTSSVAYNADTAPEGWCSISSAACIDQSRLRTDNTARRASNPTTDLNANMYGYGNYYNWYSITAGNGVYALNEDNHSTVGDLCPAGWRLPQGGNKGRIESSDDNDFWHLVVNGLNGGVKPANYNNAISPYYSGSSEAGAVEALIRSYPNNFVRSGFTSNGGTGSRGAASNYWSSTSHNDGAAYFMYFDETSVSPGTGWGGGKSTGRPARCLTPSVQWFPSEIDFDEGVASVTLDGGVYGSYTVYTNGEIVRLAGGVSYNISATYATDEDTFLSWETTSDGVIGSASSRETTFVLSDAATLTLNSKKACPAGKVCYKGNGADSETTMDRQNIGSEDTAATLWASNYKRSGYGFAGWSDAADYVVNTGSQSNPNAHIYGPNETISFTAGQYSDAESGLFLYAVWVESAGDLQGWTCPLNAVMPVGTVTALTDARDGQVYAVAKLADGNCWMVENLRLADKDGNNNAVVLSSLNTNNPSLPLTNSLDQSTGEILTSSNSLSASQDPRIDRWCSDDSAICDDQSKINNDNTINTVAKMTATNQKIYSYGVYYNWYSATAGNGKYLVSGVMDGDICPNGWFLPYGGSGAENKGGNTSGGYYYLSSIQNAFESDPVVGSGIMRKYPNNFILSGQVHDGLFHSVGEGGLYWTSRGGTNVGWSFNLSESTFNPGTGSNHKGYGRVVRCAMKGATIENLNYMQDFASLDDDEKARVLDSMVEGEQYVLKDSRDNKKYYISKLADGNVWMTQNLDYDIVNSGADINSSNTNVPDDWSDAGNLEDTRASDDMSWDGSMMTPKSYDAGDLCWRGSISIYNHNDSEPCADSLQNQANHSHVGNYYNWTAAVAMSDSSSYVAEGTDVNQSICPAGWTLPKGGTEPKTNSFANLINQQNLTSGESGNAHQAPTYFAYGGAWEGYSLDTLGLGGVAMYQTSTVISDRTAFRLFLSASNTSAPEIDGFYKGTAYSIRCMVGSSDTTQNIYDLDYMQDFANLDSTKKAQIIDSMVEGQQYQLKDSRDNKEYYISKLADGNVWMTQNLDFDIVNGGADIDSTNTDVPADWSDAGNLTNTYAASNTAWSDYDEYSESYDPGDVCWNGATLSPFESDADLAHRTGACGDDKHYHIGNYYNWTAAVAMSDSSSYNTKNEDVGQSLCPAGWKLPKAIDNGGPGSFDYLIKQQNLSIGLSGNIQNLPTYFTYGGDWYGYSEWVGAAGGYWSSSVESDGEANDLLFNTQDDLYVEGGGARGYGLSMRCIVRN